VRRSSTTWEDRTVRVYTTTPTEDPRAARDVFARLEAIGYDGAFSFEAKHDPFVPLAVAAEHTTTIELGTAIAIAFARNPMNLANLGNDLQLLTEGRFLLGLGSQIRPHIVNRYSSVWSDPARRMRELVLAVREIWRCWDTGDRLQFAGEFYRHTLMIPTFDPGPNEYGAPPVYIGGFGPQMVAVAGEVADGIITHPFTTRRSLLEQTLPALDAGLARAGRIREQCDVIAATLVVTADTEAEFARVKHAARSQLAFYGSTPAYRPTLDCHGWGDLHPELNALSKQGRWDDMTNLITDEILEAIAVVGPPDTVAAALRARLDGVAEAVSLTNTRAPDAGHWAGVVADLRRPEP
jgi:probable F420-dependent oxidoreductase